MRELRHPRVHPDGRRITFDASERKQEIWVMEHFLPELEGLSEQ
jgi:Tol biopolymer transport system component